MSAIIGKNVISGAAFAFSHLETAWKVTPNFCASSSWLNPLFFLYFNMFTAKTIFTFSIPSTPFVGYIIAHIVHLYNKSKV